MAAYLKCSLTIKDDVVRVVNSGYSLVDAEYAMSKIQSKSDLLRYDVGNIVDDIFDGSEMLFKLSGILGYFGSTVFERGFPSWTLFSIPATSKSMRAFWTNALRTIRRTWMR